MDLCCRELFRSCFDAPEVAGAWEDLVLLCHKLRRMFRGNLRAQHGHRGSIRAIATTILQWTVAIELGMCRWGRSGGAAGAVTAGNCRFREPPGATRSRGGNRLPFGDQESVGRDTQCSVMMEASPSAPFVVAELDLLLEFLVIALDAPAHFGN